jgi:hypothetical protein
MTRIYFIAILLILLSSCERTGDTPDVLLKYYGDAGEDIGYSLTQTGNAYVISGQYSEVARSTTGNYISGTSKKMSVIKTGSDGNVIWKKVLGGKLTAVGSKAIILDDGSIVSIGYAIDSITLEKNIYAVKLDAEGTVLQEKIYKSAGNQYGTDIIRIQDGFLLLGTTDVLREPVTDYTGNEAGKKDILLVRLNDNLEYSITPRAEGFIGNDEGVAIKSDINGGYIVVGTTDRSDQQTQGGNNIFLLRINSDGSTTQPRIIGGPDDEYAADIEVLNDGYLVAGTTGSEGAGQKGYAWSIPTDIYHGTVSGQPIDIEPNSATKTPFSVKAMCRYKSNFFLMAGQFGTGLSARMLIFATYGDGTAVEGEVKITGGTGTQVANDIISDNDGNITAVGKNSYETNSMISLFRFRF